MKIQRFLDILEKLEWEASWLRWAKMNSVGNSLCIQAQKIINELSKELGDNTRFFILDTKNPQHVLDNIKVIREEFGGGELT